MLHLDPKELPTAQVQSLLNGGVSPRPIALVSTLSETGIPNLSPFSWFNCFGANPPTVAFSPSRRVRDGSHKHTYYNLMATKECVIQTVSYAMVQQVSLASTEYPEGIDEFIKSGLTKLHSDIVKPFRVAESPFQMECKLQQMIHLGDGPGSGNLAICEVIRFHINEDMLTGKLLDPQKLDHVARMGGDFYSRSYGDAVFEVEKPVKRTGIGFDQLPTFVLNSHILSANNLAQLANSEAAPADDEVAQLISETPPLAYHRDTFQKYEQNGGYREMLSQALSVKAADQLTAVHLLERTARIALEKPDVPFAFKCMLFADSLRK